MSPGNRVLQFSSWNFDASVAELLMAVGSGSTLVTAGSEERLPGEPLVGLLRQHRVTHTVLPPSSLQVLPPRPLPDLACLVVAGEAVPPGLLVSWATPGRRLVNAYGPTETTVGVTAATCTGGGPPPIGSPMSNTRFEVCDETQRPVPPGLPGELLIGGVGVTRGYHGRPGLTAERFLPEPGAEPGSRRYRSGDRVRWRRDGQLDFLGRVDHQVKLRGFRIEPGEVEAVLLEEPEVEQALVVARDQVLVGYLVGKERPDLLARLEDRLPAHMVPARLVWLDAFPLTPNGKVDRSALPEPVWESSSEPPQTPAEELIAGHWRSVLNGLSGSIGRHDNFFQLGGHSLQATQVVARVAGSFGRPDPLRFSRERPWLDS